MSLSESIFKPDLSKGKVVLITGGGSGIGYEIGRQFGLHGAILVICGRREEPLVKSAETLKKEGITVYTKTCDVRKIDDCKNLIQFTKEKTGRLDVLVNNAAGNFLVNAEDLSSNGFKTVLEIDTVGVFNMSTSAMPLMKEVGGGTIINISTTFHYSAQRYQVHVAAAKAGIDAITRSLALEWGEYGIRIVGIAPGPIAGTGGLSKLGGDLFNAEEKSIYSPIPIQRLGEKVDIAYAALFLASKAASYITGDTLVVDGGEWLYKQPIMDKEMVREYSRKKETSSRTIGVAGENKSKL